MLELQAICKHWQPHTPRHAAPRALLQDLTLQVRPGETAALLGPSGSGKSTLLKIVVGLEPPESGRVLFAGQDITATPPERRGFALMFQDFVLFPHLNVRDNVAFGLVEQGMRKADARAQAVAMLERFGLQAYAKSKVWQLSGGEQQRVALARALITQPRVLLLDEPFSALDAELRLQLRQEFVQRIAEFQMATVVVTHDETEARAMGTRGYRLVDGALAPQW
ncbi:ABC transporter [Rhodoferax sp. TH121]|uniref:ABC transporter ATP-binding protein n=1 Tax=Rhodoferax sp. TH121 TaxID=2022803 RepID=UPI000B967524|nr:ABC transporter ATP-binding protein [Rhodoferax sp. TH121]OYQ40828.1 ABC transporter [Rhodoferax sp. TH121]